MEFRLAVLASQVPQVSSTATALSSMQRPPVREANFNAKLKVGSRLFAVNKEVFRLGHGAPKCRNNRLNLAIFEFMCKLSL